MLADLVQFLPSLETLAAYTLAVVVLTITPGPDMTLFLGQTVSNGRMAGFASMAGASTGMIVHTLFAAFGLSALLRASPEAFTLLKWIGAGYLLFLAVDAIRKGAGLTQDPATMKRTSLGRAFRKGLLINLLNPKIILFFVTFLPQFVAASDPHAGGKLVFLGLWFLVIATPLVVPMILAAERIAGFLKSSKRATRIFDWSFAGVMSAFAVKLLLTQAR
ncbi:MAG: LysE family translocator [Hyphomicrobiaceae bacterium]|nr:LysE family translocator [Hyphomicrobiaceae bacterium]